MTELTPAEADGLVDVRLVMSRVFEREGDDAASSELAATPGRVTTVEDGHIYSYERVAYGLIRKSEDGREDFVWERRFARGRIESRLFNRTGRLLRRDVAHGSPSVDWFLPTEIVDLIAEVSPIGDDPTRN